MRIKNTSSISDDVVKEAVQFAGQGTNTSGVMVNVKNSTKYDYAGKAFYHVPYISPASKMKSVRYLVVCRIGDSLPTSANGHCLKTIPEFQLNTKEEVLVYLAAHELYHIKLAKSKKNKQSEKKPTLFGIKKVEEWRKLYPTEIPPISPITITVED